MTHTCLPEKRGGADLGGAQTSAYDYVGEDQVRLARDASHITMHE